MMNPIPFRTTPEQASRIASIVAKMKEKGVPSDFLHSVWQLAEFDQGVFDLMGMWAAAELDPVGQEALIVDLHEALVDYDSDIPPAESSDIACLDRPTMVAQAKQLLSEAEIFGFEVKPGTKDIIAAFADNDPGDRMQLWRAFCDQCVHADSYAIGTVTRTMHTACAELLQQHLTTFNKRVFANMVATTRKLFLERDPENEKKATRFSATKHKQAQINKSRASTEAQANSAWGGGD